jgi:hypothetical protein
MSYVYKSRVRLSQTWGGGAREHGESYFHVSFADVGSNPARSTFLPNLIATGDPMPEIWIYTRLTNQSHNPFLNWEEI